MPVLYTLQTLVSKALCTSPAVSSKIKVCRQGFHKKKKKKFTWALHRPGLYLCLLRVLELSLLNMVISSTLPRVAEKSSSMVVLHSPPPPPVFRPVPAPTVFINFVLV